MRWATTRVEKRPSVLGPTRHLIDLSHLDPRGRGRRWSKCGKLLDLFPVDDRWDPSHPRVCFSCRQALALDR